MTDTGTDGSAPAAYLVVLRHVLVAQDIAMTIGEFDPAARIVTAASAAEALPLLEGLDRVTVAFLAVGPDRLTGTPLAAALKDRDARVVLMGEEAEAQGEAAGFAVLARPFTTFGILSHLEG